MSTQKWVNNNGIEIDPTKYTNLTGTDLENWATSQGYKKVESEPEVDSGNSGIQNNNSSINNEPAVDNTPKVEEVIDNNANNNKITVSDLNTTPLGNDGVNNLFKTYYNRDATQEELNYWSSKSDADLRPKLSANEAYGKRDAAAAQENNTGTEEVVDDFSSYLDSISKNNTKTGSGSTDLEAGTHDADLSPMDNSEIQAIYEKYGIPGLEESVYSVTSPDTQARYQELYESANLGLLKQEIEDLLTSKNELQATLDEKLAEIADNPWLTNAKMIGYQKRAESLYIDKINALTDGIALKQELYTNSISEINNVITRETNDFNNSQALKTAKLNNLLAKAEAEINLTNEERATKKTELESKIATINEFAVSGYRKITSEDDLAKVRELAKKLGVDAEDLLLRQQDSSGNEIIYFNSAYYQKLISSTDGDYQFINGNDNTPAGVFNKNTGEFTKLTNVSEGIVGGYDISSYATDEDHEALVARILEGIGQFKTVADIDEYIQSKYPDSPITGQMVASTSEKYGIEWEMLVAMMEQDSSLGTAGKGARTYNPGNVGNDDSGNMVNYGTWQAGVDAVGNWLNNHRATPSSTDTADLSDKDLIKLDIQEITGQNKKLDTAKYEQIRENVKNNTPELLSWFDKTWPVDEFLDKSDPTAAKYFTSSNRSL